MQEGGGDDVIIFEVCYGMFILVRTTYDNARRDNWNDRRVMYLAT
jgi:hypothetical protein